LAKAGRTRIAGPLIYFSLTANADERVLTLAATFLIPRYIIKMESAFFNYRPLRDSPTT
jgi:hypothetical protein